MRDPVISQAQRALRQARRVLSRQPPRREVIELDIHPTNTCLVGLGRSPGRAIGVGHRPVRAPDLLQAPATQYKASGK
jgi:hypothetical protein